MCVIYMMSEDTKAIKDHGRLLLYRKEEKIASQPISRISSVVVTKQAHITMPLVYALLEEGIPISYMDFRGRVLGVLGGERISLEHLFRQKEVMERPKEQIRLVREIVCRKIGSQRRLLKEYSYRERELQAMAALGRLTAYAHKAEYLMDIEELRDVRGLLCANLEGGEDEGGRRDLHCGIAAREMRHTRRGVHKNADKIKC